VDMLNNHYFIALPIQPHLRKTLQEIQMKTHLGFFKHIVYPEDFHITVAFLGGADERQLSDLHEGLQRVAKVMQPFKLEVEELHYFGSESRPRVLYADVIRTNQLEKLHQEVIQMCQFAGFSLKEREYSPHVTLAKKWYDPTKEIKPNWPILKRESQEVSSVKLYRVAPDETPRYKGVTAYEFTH
jgi:RNA 2',3'-cyclic 3'-phosphodiesterase